MKRYTLMSGAMVETFNSFDGKPSGEWVRHEDAQEELLDCRAKLALAAEAEMGTDDLFNRIKPWLDNRENDIADGIEDFGELQSVFRDLFGREPKKKGIPYGIT